VTASWKYIWTVLQRVFSDFMFWDPRHRQMWQLSDERSESLVVIVGFSKRPPPTWRQTTVCLTAFPRTHIPQVLPLDRREGDYGHMPLAGYLALNHCQACFP